MAGFFAVETPQALPGSCKVCGGANKKLYLDTGTLEEFHGAVFYCIDCFGEMAAVMGFVTPVENLKTLELLESLLQERQAIQAVVKEFINAAGSNLNLSLVVNTTDDSILESINVLKQKLSRGTNQLGEGTRKTPEPSNDEGMDLVHSNDSGFKFSLPNI